MLLVGVLRTEDDLPGRRGGAPVDLTTDAGDILDADQAPAAGRVGPGDQAPLEGPAALRHLGEQPVARSEEHTSELQSRPHLVCRLLLEKKKKKRKKNTNQSK